MPLLHNGQGGINSFMHRSCTLRAAVLNLVSLQIFEDLKRSYTTIELDKRDDGDEIQSILGEMTGARTVPRVFVKGVCLGGGTDVKKLYETGELQKKF